jgi:membrane protease YdiL (CAAX protease family)
MNDGLSNKLLFLSRLFMLAGVFMLSQAVFSLLGIALCTALYDMSYGEVVAFINKPKLSPEGVYTQRWVQSFYNIGSFLVTAVVFTGFYRKHIGDTLGFRATVKVKLLPGLLLLFIPAIFVISGIAEFNNQLPGVGRFVNLNELQETRNALLEVLLHSFYPSDVAVLVFTLAVVPAFCEEVFFRGLLLPFFGDWLKNKHAGVWISAILFTILHFSVTQFLPILFMGVVLGYIYMWTRSIWAPVLVHFLNNASTVVFHRLSQTYPDVFLFHDNYHPTVAVFSIASATLLLLLFWLRRQSSTEQPSEALWP